jgi:prepilin-type N-terminal cleavage/methylation domain-containing protein
MHTLPATPAAGPREHGFTLIEALVALMIVAMVVMQFLGIRTSALIDATQGAQLAARARDRRRDACPSCRPARTRRGRSSGDSISLERVRGFSYKIVIGESEVAHRVRTRRQRRR